MEEAKKTYYAPMHSCEHILSGTIVKAYGCDRPFSTHIEKKKSKIDFHTDRIPIREDLDRIEVKVNEVIAQKLDITEVYIPYQEAAEHYNLDRLPDNAGDTVRIVQIGDYDACPYIGDHVKNTSEIPPVKIISADNQSSVLRIRFKLLKKEPI